MLPNSLPTTIIVSAGDISPVSTSNVAPNPNPTTGVALNPLGPTVSISYPPDLANTGVRLALGFYQYQKASVVQRSQYVSRNLFIFLPIPDNLVETHSVGYGEFHPGYIPQMYSGSDFGAGIGTGLGATALALLSYNLENMVGKGLAGMGAIALAGVSIRAFMESYRKDPDFFKTQAGAAGMAGIRRVISGMPEEISGLFDNYFGTTPNPNSTVSLKSPALRSHEFSWVFGPRNKQETDIIERIRVSLDSEMLPGIDSTRFFLEYPDIVYPEFIGATNLFTFKPCVITDVQFNNAAAGKPSFINTTKAPTIISCTIRLQEIELFTKNDVSLTQEQIYTQGQAIGGTLGQANTTAGNLVSDDLNVLKGNK